MAAPAHHLTRRIVIAMLAGMVLGVSLNLLGASAWVQAVLVDVNRFSGKAPNAAVCSRLKSDVYKAYIFRTLGA